MTHSKKIQGFTLIELMITVAVMGIMAAIAFPSMSNFVSNTRLANRAQQTANLFRFAKGEAVRMGVPVVICGVQIRSDGRHSGNCDGAQASSGLMAYADMNRDGKYDSDVDNVLRTVNINGNDKTPRVVVGLKTCAITGSADCAADASNTNEYIFMPNGFFGYKTKSDTTRANLQSNVNLASHYVRISLKDSKNDKLAAQYVVISPTGMATTCRAGDTTYKTYESQSDSKSSRICVAEA